MKVSFRMSLFLALIQLAACSGPIFTHKAPDYKSRSAHFEKHSQHHSGRSMDQDGYRVRYKSGDRR